MKKTSRSLDPKKNSYDWLQIIHPTNRKCHVDVFDTRYNITLQKTYKKVFNDPNVCHLIKGSNFSIVNRGNKKLIILDNKLNILKHIKLNREFEIYGIMTSANECEFLLYDLSNDALIYLNILRNKVHFHSIHHIQEQLTLLYLWQENHITFTTRSGSCYILDLVSNQIRAINLITLQQEEPAFYKFWQYCIPYYPNITQIDPYCKTFVYEDEGQNQITLFDFVNNNKIIAKKPRTNPSGNQYHDIIYHNGFFALISEEEIIITSGAIHYQLGRPNSRHTFLRAYFFEENENIYLMVLSSNQSTASALTTYEIR